MTTAHNPAWYTSPETQSLEGDVLWPVTVTTHYSNSEA